MSDVSPGKRESHEASKWRRLSDHQTDQQWSLWVRNGFKPHWSFTETKSNPVKFLQYIVFKTKIILTQGLFTSFFQSFEPNVSWFEFLSRHLQWTFVFSNLYDKWANDIYWHWVESFGETVFFNCFKDQEWILLHNVIEILHIFYVWLYNIVL